MFKRLPGDEACNLINPTEIEKGPPPYNREGPSTCGGSGI